MSKIFKLIVFISISFFFYGCDFIFLGKNMLDKKIQQIEINKPMKVGRVVESSSETVCILVPYQTFLKDDSNKQIKTINRKIESENLLIDEGHWHLVLKEYEKISFISERVSSSFSVKQGGFSDAENIFFSEVNFKPLSCVKFNEAYFLKYKQNNRVYLSLGVKAI